MGEFAICAERQQFGRVARVVLVPKLVSVQLYPKTTTLSEVHESCPNRVNLRFMDGIRLTTTVHGKPPRGGRAPYL